MDTAMHWVGGGAEGEKERGRERDKWTLTKPKAQSPPNKGLHLRTPRSEIMTWEEIKTLMSNRLSPQAPPSFFSSYCVNEIIVRWAHFTTYTNQTLSYRPYTYTEMYVN